VGGERREEEKRNEERKRMEGGEEGRGEEVWGMREGGRLGRRRNVTPTTSTDITNIAAIWVSLLPPPL
jgi:hypothetical protein